MDAATPQISPDHLLGLRAGTGCPGCCQKYSLIPLLGLTTCLYLLTGMTSANWAWFLGWLLIIIFYFLYGYRKKQTGPARSRQEESNSGCSLQSGWHFRNFAVWKFQMIDRVLILHSTKKAVVDIMNEKMVMSGRRGVRFPPMLTSLTSLISSAFSEPKLSPSQKKSYIDDVPKKNQLR